MGRGPQDQRLGIRRKKALTWRRCSPQSPPPASHHLGRSCLGSQPSRRLWLCYSLRGRAASALGARPAGLNRQVTGVRCSGPSSLARFPNEEEKWNNGSSQTPPPDLSSLVSSEVSGPTSDPLGAQGDSFSSWIEQEEGCFWSPHPELSGWGLCDVMAGRRIGRRG